MMTWNLLEGPSKAAHLIPLFLWSAKAEAGKDPAEALAELGRITDNISRGRTAATCDVDTKAEIQAYNIATWPLMLLL